LAVFEVNLLLGLAFEIDVEPLSELTSRDEEVGEVVLVKRGEKNNDNVVFCQTDFFLNSGELLHFGLDIVNSYLIDCIRKLVSDHLFLLVKITVALLPFQNFVCDLADCLFDVFDV
jgi:hypothetical protein